MKAEYLQQHQDFCCSCFIYHLWAKSKTRGGKTLHYNRCMAFSIFPNFIFLLIHFVLFLRSVTWIGLVLLSFLWNKDSHVQKGERASMRSPSVPETAQWKMHTQFYLGTLRTLALLVWSTPFLLLPLLVRLNMTPHSLWLEKGPMSSAKSPPVGPFSLLPHKAPVWTSEPSSLGVGVLYTKNHSN